MNRAERRAMWRIGSTREQRMVARRHKRAQQRIAEIRKWNREKARRMVEGIKAGNIEMQQGIVTEGEE